MFDPHLALSKLERAWHFFRWRTIVVALVWLTAFLAFTAGAGTTERPGIPEADWTVRAYYAVGMFVLGGLDLGLPKGGPDLARHALWVAYVVAPIITAGALIDSILRAVNPRRWVLRRLKDHFVIAGCGKLTMQYLTRLRQVHPLRPVVIVEKLADSAMIKEAREVHGAYVLTGDIVTPALLELLQLDVAARVMLLTDDDLANLDAATRILALAPSLRGKVVVHLTDLQLRHVVAKTSLSQACVFFNTHQIAAARLVEKVLLPHFETTGPQDSVVLAGFGRFGQTVLDELQRHAIGTFQRVVMVDLECDRKSRSFGERVGYLGGYAREAREGDLRDPALWATLEATFAEHGECPVFVLGSGDDRVNLNTALWLARKYADALVVVRHFKPSTFIAEVAEEARFVPCCEAEVLVESIPREWLAA